MADLTNDLLLAYPPVGAAKLSRLVALPRHIDLKVGLDSPEVLDALAEAARGAGRTIGVLVEQDVGLGRVGLQTAAGVVALADRVRGLEGVRFRGIMFYPGHVRSASDADQDQALKAVSRRLRQTLKALRDAGLDPEIVSGGSTPTLWRSHELKGVTEIRSGSCIYHDREGIDLGVATLDDVAYTVLATVVSTAVPGHAVVDAGSKALAKEARGASGYGILLDHPDVVVNALSEEHGVLDLAATTWRPRIGERVRIVPNHVCVSVNLQDRMLAQDGDVHGYLRLEGRGRGPWTG
jgi:D-serine deaminase-like pyridoxal phosphate-dependent protein